MTSAPQREKFGRRLCVVGKVESGGIPQFDRFSLRLSRTAVIEAQHRNAVPGETVGEDEKGLFGPDGLVAVL